MSNEQALHEALQQLHEVMRESMGTGGWVPSPLHSSFIHAMIDAKEALALPITPPAAAPAPAVRIYDYVWPQNDEAKGESVYFCNYTPEFNLGRGARLFVVVDPKQLPNAYLQREDDAQLTDAEPAPIYEQWSRHTTDDRPFASTAPAPAVPNVELRPEDFTVEVIGTPMGGFNPNVTHEVRVTHKPTGMSVSCNTERSQHKNRHIAFEQIKAMLADPCRIAPQPPVTTSQEPTKDHIIREAVNQLRDCAIKFHATQQLRERIAEIVVPLLKPAPAPAPAIPSQPAVPQGTNWHAHHVIVSKAALQMVRNALRNDAERGLVVRGEMLEELDKVTYPVASASPAPLLVRDVAEMLGTDVSHVCKAFIDLGLPPQRSTNMEVTPDEAVAVAKHLAATPSQEPVTLTDDQRVELDYLLERAIQAVDLLHYIRCHPKRHDLEREWLNKADTVIGYWDAQNTKMRTSAMIAALREKENSQ